MDQIDDDGPHVLNQGPLCRWSSPAKGRKGIIRCGCLVYSRGKRHDINKPSQLWQSRIPTAWVVNLIQG